jgi:hypothetical protein
MCVCVRGSGGGLKRVWRASTGSGMTCAPCASGAMSNGKESTVNKALGGSPYPGKKLVRSSLCKFFLVVMKHSNLYLGLVLPSGG